MSKLPDTTQIQEDDGGTVSTVPVNNMGDGNISGFDPLMKFKLMRRKQRNLAPKKLRLILGDKDA